MVKAPAGVRLGLFFARAWCGSSTSGQPRCDRSAPPNRPPSTNSAPRRVSSCPLPDASAAGTGGLNCHKAITCSPVACRPAYSERNGSASRTSASVGFAVARAAAQPASANAARRSSAARLIRCLAIVGSSECEQLCRVVASPPTVNGPRTPLRWGGIKRTSSWQGAPPNRCSCPQSYWASDQRPSALLTPANKGPPKDVYRPPPGRHACRFEKLQQRGAGRIRTDDGGFAI